MIKLTCLIGLVIAPILGGHSVSSENKKHATKEVKVKLSKEGNLTVANVTVITKKDGKKTELNRKIKGAEAEVRATIDSLYGEKSDTDIKIKKIIKKEIHEEKDHKGHNH